MFVRHHVSHGACGSKPDWCCLAPRRLNGSSVHLHRRHQRLCGQPRDPLSKDMVKVSRVFIRVIGGDVSIGAPEGSQPGSVLRGGGSYETTEDTKKINCIPHHQTRQVW